MHFSVQKHYIQFARILLKYIISLISQLFNKECIGHAD